MVHSRNDEAVSLAVQGRWAEAVLVNQEILEVSPNDIDALNRLGKALSELGRNTESREAYERVLELDRHNNIAWKNLERLSRLKEDEPVTKKLSGIDSRFFIEETSKARRVNLHRIAPRGVLVKMSAGEQVLLQVNSGKLEVANYSGEYLGEVEPRIGARLARLIGGGNEYKAVIVNLWSDEVKVIIRETFQHPSQAGYPSFPPPKIGGEIRPYLKDSMVKREIEEVPLVNGDDDDNWNEEEEESPEESGFTIDDEATILGKGDMDKVL